MGTITLVPPVASTGITAAIFSNAYTIIQNVANGNIDAANFASGAIFDSTKLMQNGADTRHVVGWNGSQWQPQLSPIRFFDTTLGANAATIDIPNIPQTHQGLLAVVYARMSQPTTSINLELRFNGDSGTNYDQQQVYGQAAAPNATETFAATKLGMIAAPGSTAGANLFTAAVIQIPNYAGTTNNKACSSVCALKQTAVTGNLFAISRAGFWRSNTAITQITFADYTTSSNIVSGSRVSLYLMP